MSTIIFHFYLLSFVSYCNHAQYQPLPIRTATLTTSKTSENGANATILDADVVTVSNNMWHIDIPYSMYLSHTDQIGFDMFINLNELWGFHPSKESRIDFTMYSDTSTGRADEDLIISFSVGNARYFSIFFTLDNNYGNAIYPTCGGPLASGDINRIVSMNGNTARELKAFANSCCNYRLQPNSNTCNNYWPITISLKNNPSSNRLYLYVTNAVIKPYVQTCEFASSFPPNKGLQIYIGSDEYNDESINLKQFKIDYSFQLTYPPTNNPSSPPTLQPTYVTPTMNPTRVPTENPTKIPTPFPTYSPTESPTTLPPTLFPTISPTLFPSTSPSNIPTSTPTLHPTISPSNIPTTTPTSLPTTAPTPTSHPTLSPTKMPTSSPTPRPVIIISVQTTSPSNELEHGGSIDQELSSTTAVLSELSSMGNTLIMYYIIVIVIFSCCLCCTLALLCRCKRNKKQQYLGNNEGATLRIDSTSKQFVIATDLCAPTDQQQFAHNLTLAVGVNNILIDGDDMMGDTGQTRQFPAPPIAKRAKSNINECNVEMSTFVTPVDDDTGTGTEDTGTDEMGTNESVMEDTLTNANNDGMHMDDMDVMDDIVITPKGYVMNAKEEYNNPNVMRDEFIIGSEGELNYNDVTL